MKLPSFMLQQLYRQGSLERISEGYRFVLQNPLLAVTIEELLEVRVNGEAIAPEALCFDLIEPSGATRPIAPGAPVDFARGAATVVSIKGRLEDGEHALCVQVSTEQFGTLAITGRDTLA